MTENEKKVSDRIRQRKRRYHLTILILMVLLLLTLFVVQCELSKMQSDMLAEREAMLDSISTYDNLRLDSLKRYNDSLEAARADSIARYNDSLAIQQPKELSPEEKAHQDSIAKRRKEIRDSLEREKKGSGALLRTEHRNPIQGPWCSRDCCGRERGSSLSFRGSI